MPSLWIAFLALFLASTAQAADARAYLLKSTNGSSISVFKAPLEDLYGFSIDGQPYSDLLLSADDSRAALFTSMYSPGSSLIVFEEIDLTTRRVLRTLPIPGGILNGLSGFIDGTAPSRDGKYVYAVTASDSNEQGSVLRVNVAENTISVLFTESTFQMEDVALSPDGSILYVAAVPYAGTGAVGAILKYSTSTFQSLGNIPVAEPKEMTLSPDGTTLYVHTYPPTSACAVFDAATGLQKGGFACASGIVLSPDSAYAYVGQESVPGSLCGPQCLVQISTANLTVAKTLPLGDANLFYSLAISADGNSLALSTPSVLLVDVPSFSIVAKGPTGTTGGLVFAHRSNSLFVTEYDNSSLTAVDATTGTKVGEYASGTNPGSVAVSPDGNTLYVSDVFSSVACLSATSGALLATIALPRSHEDSLYAGPLVLSPDGSTLYVSLTQSVAKIDTATHLLIQILTGPVGFVGGETSLAISPDGYVLYAARSGTLFSLSTATGEILNVAATNPSARFLGVAASPDGSRVYALSTNVGDVFSELAAGSLMSMNDVTFADATSSGGLTVSSDNASVYVAAGNVFVFNVASGAFAEVTTSGGDTNIALTSDGREAVASSGSVLGVVDILDLPGLTARQPIPIGAESAAVAAH